MAQLIVRNLDSELVQRLKTRAASLNHSAEEEHRLILQAALSRPKRRTFTKVLTQMPYVGEDSDFARE